MAKTAKTYLATLDENGKIPSSQLPSYVDDVLEYSSKASFPTTGEASKIYVDTTSNLTYRWSGTKYVEISPSLALGETSSTAYRGDRGKVAYDHSQSAHAPSNAQQNVQSDWNATSGDAFIKNKPTIPTKVGELTNDKDYATKNEVAEAIDDIEIGGRNLISNIASNWQQGHWDNTDGNYMNYDGRICTKVGLKVSPGETYAVKIYLNGVTDKHLLFRTYGIDGSFIGSVYSITNRIYTVPSNVYELRFVLYENVTLDDLTNGVIRVKVEKGNKATDWTPVPEDTEAEIDNSIIELSMLGWSVPRECPIQNEVNGNQFIQKVGRVDLGSLEYVNHEDYGVYTYAIRNKIKVHVVVETASNIYCRDYLTVSWDNLSNQGKVDTNYIASSGDGAIGFNTTLSAEQFQSKMQGQYLYYELATPITTTIDGNEIGETVSDVRKETTVNLLKPTLGTITKNGVTCTNNGDGTYTIDTGGSPATGNTIFTLSTFIFNANTKYKLIGCPSGGSNSTYRLDTAGINNDIGNGSDIQLTQDTTYHIRIDIASGTVCENLVFKPMLTTNLNATYDNFVPYTGITGQINSDVAEVRKDFDEHTHEIADVTGLQSALSGKLDKFTSGGIASCNGGGEYDYFKIATIKITSPWVNRPIVFELSGRGRGLSLVTIEFVSLDTPDPELSFFESNYDICFWIKKTTTSTWEVYGKYSESWGDYTIHRITGSGADANLVDITVNMENIDSLPSGCTQVSYGGNVNYANSSGNADTLEGNHASAFATASHTHSNYLTGITKDMVTTALGYTPPTTDTWRGIQNNLTSDSTTDSLSAAQGKVLKDLVDGKADINHAHDYFPLSGGYAIRGKAFFNSNGTNAYRNGYIEAPTPTSLVVVGPSPSAEEYGFGLEFKSCISGILPYTSVMTTRTDAIGAQNFYTLGSPTRRFGNIYSSGSLTTTSDEKLKKDISLLSDESEIFESLFDNVELVKFRWKDNNNTALETKPSCRFHYGVKAQQVEDLMHTLGLTNYDNGFIHSGFFLGNETECYISGGYRCAKEGYDYSENVYNYKNDLEYEVFNEIIEKPLYQLDIEGRYTHRQEIQYIMFQDISKVRKKGNQPPLTINSIHFVDKDGNYIPVKLSTDGAVSCYDPDEDITKANGGSCGTINDDGSLTVTYDDMWCSYMIKIAEDDNCYNFYDYESIIVDVDFIGEYKVYLIPKGEYQNCNFWNDRDRCDKVAYDYSFNYQEFTNMGLAVLQNTRKEYKEYKVESERRISELENEVAELKDLVNKLIGGAN